jgi:hypothetical protein
MGEDLPDYLPENALHSEKKDERLAQRGWFAFRLGSSPELFRARPRRKMDRKIQLRSTPKIYPMLIADGARHGSRRAVSGASLPLNCATASPRRVT